jgi:hypothetical protein
MEREQPEASLALLDPIFRRTLRRLLERIQTMTLVEFRVVSVHVEDADGGMKLIQQVVVQPYLGDLNYREAPPKIWNALAFFAETRYQFHCAIDRAAGVARLTYLGQ